MPSTSTRGKVTLLIGSVPASCRAMMPLPANTIASRYIRKALAPKNSPSGRRVLRRSRPQLITASASAPHRAPSSTMFCPAAVVCSHSAWKNRMVSNTSL